MRSLWHYKSNALASETSSFQILFIYLVIYFVIIIDILMKHYSLSRVKLTPLKFAHGTEDLIAEMKQ